MATRVSRWAQSEEDAGAKARRKREKEEKRKAKEEGAAANQQEQIAEKSGERSPKRQRRRCSSDASADEGAQTLPLVSRGFRPSASVEEYELLNSIEEGSYGKVSRARDKRDGQVVALKKLKVDQSHDGFPITGLREIETLRACSHPHIVGLREVVTGPSLSEFTSSPAPANLTQLVVTLWYRAPELLLGVPSYSFEVDIWSLGCVLAELLTLEPLFQGKNEIDQLSLIFAMLGTPSNESWPGFRSLPNTKALHSVLKNPNPTSRLGAGKFPYLTASGLGLLSAMLALNPADRPTADQVLEHQYFSQDPKAKPKEMFPTFPSKAGQEKRRRRATPQAPVRGAAPAISEHEAVSIFAQRDQEEQGAGFALRMA
ncbi:hypothetical protein DV738_g418, partial [Chaetothyriales sp. CBS 135597]